ncbi:MAG: hypothetical protein QGG54_21355, partial [Gammaproteobacteria bacterium]|nr:hypothetical protein [Gammaproteobacteria bacterium]
MKANFYSSGTGRISYSGSHDRVAGSGENRDASHHLDSGKCIGIDILLASYFDLILLSTHHP